MKTWLITGVSSGLGRAIAEAALARGDAVAGTVRNETAGAAFESLAPGRAHALLFDLRDLDAVPNVVGAAEKALGGRIDILVNNAGYGLVGAVEETSISELRDQFEVNTLAPFAMMKAVLPAMRARRGGRIINVTSVSGLAVWAGTGVYCASKFALEALGQTLAQEVAELGIKVVHIAPGGLRTDYSGRSMVLTADSFSDYDGLARDAKRIMADHAGHEPGDPKKAALAILKAADMEAPPMHLLLGADALLYATRHMSGLLAEIGANAATSTSIAFD